MSERKTKTEGRERRELVRKIAYVLNSSGREEKSNTPDFILAEHMVVSLENFEKSCNRREKWYNDQGLGR